MKKEPDVKIIAHKDGTDMEFENFRVACNSEFAKSGTVTFRPKKEEVGK